jgi:DNA-binding GntR family transcriptional regulator
MAWVGTKMEILQPLEIRAEKEAADRLNLPSEEVGFLTTLRLNNGVPFAVSHIYLPPETAKRLEAESLPKEGEGTVVGQLEPFIYRPVVEASQDITAIPASANVAELIDCQPGEPILHIHRIFLDSDGKPVELAISNYNSRRFSYSIKLRRKAS